jgi:hypothetical protein
MAWGSALFLLLSISSYAAVLPCDRVEEWRQLAPLKKLSVAALEREAFSGDAFAQFFLGTLYLDGKLANKDEPIGISWLQRSAMNGFSRSQLFVGEFHESGKLLPRDPEEALNWYKKAANQGDCEAESFLGWHYLGNHFDVETNTWNDNGQKDPRLAIFWLQRSGEHGDPDAQVELGRLYEEGEGVDQNYAEAAFWYRKAADHGPDLGGAGQGRNRLGLLYLEGRGVTQDYIEAYKWFALTGHNAELQVSDRMSKSEIMEGRRRVSYWKQQHSAEIMEAKKVFGGAYSD